MSSLSCFFHPQRFVWFGLRFYLFCLRCCFLVAATWWFLILRVWIIWGVVCLRVSFVKMQRVSACLLFLIFSCRCIVGGTAHKLFHQYFGMVWIIRSYHFYYVQFWVWKAYAQARIHIFRNIWVIQNRFLQILQVNIDSKSLHVRNVSKHT